MRFEETKLYQLISTGTPEALRHALGVISGMTDDEVQVRSKENKSNFLHHIVNCSVEVYKREGSLCGYVPIIYRLALRGINMNAQNGHGNTCLHLACIRPTAESLCEHLIRIGKFVFTLWASKDS